MWSFRWPNGLIVVIEHFISFFVHIVRRKDSLPRTNTTAAGTSVHTSIHVSLLVRTFNLLKSH